PVRREGPGRVSFRRPTRRDPRPPRFPARRRSRARRRPGRMRGPTARPAADFVPAPIPSDRVRPLQRPALTFALLGSQITVTDPSSLRERLLSAVESVIIASGGALESPDWEEPPERGEDHMSKPIDMSLAGRTAMVTGGGSGLGYQYSEA